MEIHWASAVSREECARLIDRARLAREGGPWLAFQDDQPGIRGEVSLRGPFLFWRLRGVVGAWPQFADLSFV